MYKNSSSVSDAPEINGTYVSGTLISELYREPTTNVDNFKGLGFFTAVQGL
jgi:hypothetical protein